MLQRPGGLPRSFDRIWEALARADEEMHSRRNLSRRLQVSTHTLQRILRDGDVPDLSEPQSTYVLSSWTRTIARIAAGLEIDPWELIASTGIEPDHRTREIVQSELSKTGRQPSVRSGAGSSPATDLAGFIMALIDSGTASGSAGEAARLELLASLRSYLVSTGVTPPGMAGEAELSTGSYCRSCMASLMETHNKGASDEYCRWCSDSEGNLKSPDEVQEILTNWFMRWQKGITREAAARRVYHYMRAMPAWAGLGNGLERS